MKAILWSRQLAGNSALNRAMQGATLASAAKNFS